MRAITIIGPLLLALALPGCAPLQTIVPSAPAGIDVDAMLRYLHRLNQAGAPELATIGARLPPDGGPTAILRRALWQGTPGHAGYAPDRAVVAMESLLGANAELNDEGRVLVQVQLQQLRERERLLAARAQVLERNRELERQIEELTALERRMGGAGDAE